jgi:hypothetical protein
MVVLILQPGRHGRDPFRMPEREVMPHFVEKGPPGLRNPAGEPVPRFPGDNAVLATVEQEARHLQIPASGPQIRLLEMGQAPVEEIRRQARCRCLQGTGIPDRLRMRKSAVLPEPTESSVCISPEPDP